VIIGGLWEDIEQYRLVYIGGAYGTGKTLLTVPICEHYHKLGYRVFANFALAFNSPLTPDLLTSGLRKAVIVLDEAGSRYLDARSWNSGANKGLLSVMDYCRKQELVFLFPSKTEIDKRARQLTIGRNLVGHKLLLGLGLGEVLWHYFSFPIQAARSTFWLLCPYAYYGLYDTVCIPGAYGDGVAMLLQDFQEMYSYDVGRAEAARVEMRERLLDGESVPPLLPGGAAPTGPTPGSSGARSKGDYGQAMASV